MNGKTAKMLKRLAKEVYGDEPGAEKAMKKDWLSMSQKERAKCRRDYLRKLGRI